MAGLPRLNRLPVTAATGTLPADVMLGCGRALRSRRLMRWPGGA